MSGTRAAAVVVVALIAIAAVAALVVPGPAAFNPGARLTAAGFRVTDLTGSLGPSFHPGIILGAGSNRTSTLFGGIGVYHRSPDFSLPALAEITPADQPLAASNLTPLVIDYFWLGGVYGIGWNGSSWMLAGQAAWGGGTNNWGAAVTWENGVLVNRTAGLGRVFDGGGIFAMGWNGSSWLLGGNNTSGRPTLESFDGTHSVDLSSRIVFHKNNGSWLQLTAWNGREWLVGGEGVLGILSGTSFLDLYPQSPFVGSGVWTADWNGTAWLVGGGGGHLAVVEGSAIQTVANLAPNFNQAVLIILHEPGGWLVAGKGSTSRGMYAPELVYWRSTVPTSAPMDYSGSLPVAFRGGEIQSGALAPGFCPGCAVLVGEGSYNTASGFGVGAVALLEPA
ncbi:MAG TPA: hypothetical protein VFF67_06555 [Thermoplasmata archaeon]|nr:hypothetical protein [Thermoplasmata archaeon]